MVEAGYKVELSPRSLRDLEEIVTFITADNSQAAERFGQQLIDEAEAIGPHRWQAARSPSLLILKFASASSARIGLFIASTKNSAWLSCRVFGMPRAAHLRL
jgi:hypothetical protein